MIICNSFNTDWPNVFLKNNLDMSRAKFGQRRNQPYFRDEEIEEVGIINFVCSGCVGVGYEVNKFKKVAL